MVTNDHHGAWGALFGLSGVTAPNSFRYGTLPFCPGENDRFVGAETTPPDIQARFESDRENENRNDRFRCKIPSCCHI